ncbi:MAG: DNA mismatch repair endonuclease MutL [Deltaproteobacteria bacterium]|nr:MAG: DNA mismatch repair endonuclease MutL [Deltaproteobacteria bacterium]
MAKIRVMAENLANKIAAGEVVERPASVVKELVENAIDAQAKKIIVEIEGPVCRNIRVIDNGTGMEEDDVLLALERHATSKICTEEDLVAIKTLGFRGEALPSLAAVSRVELQSRTRESTAGTCLRVAAGVVKEVRQCGCPPGTQLWIRDLFFNQPARRKFLRRERTEFAHVLDTVTRLALARADIHFSLRHGNRQGHDWPAATSLQQRLEQVFPKGLAQSWLSCSHNETPVNISGYLSPPEVRRPNSRMLFLYVNGRPIRDRLLSVALMEAYRTLIPKGQFPMGVLFLELSAELVDVNVHPAKAEVRFHNPGAVFKAVTSAAENALVGMERRRWQRRLGTDTRLQPAVVPTPQRLGFSLGEKQQIAEPGTPGFMIKDSVRYEMLAEEETTKVAEEEPKDIGPFFGELTVIGQLHNTYILCETPDGLILIDQHAAHERAHYEALRRESTKGPLASQILMAPATVEVTAEEAVWLEETLSLFQQLGFSLDPFGDHTLVVRSVPAVALRQEPLVLLREIVATGCSRGSYPTSGEVLEDLLQSMACRLAIKAGQRLTNEEMVALLRQLDGLQQCATCPHGRPLWWKLTKAELERIFNRS